jgi:hypothetical protein
VLDITRPQISSLSPVTPESSPQRSSAHSGHKTEWQQSERKLQPSAYYRSNAIYDPVGRKDPVTAEIWQIVAKLTEF